MLYNNAGTEPLLEWKEQKMTVDDSASAANPDCTDSLTALRRMALMARELAVRTYTAIVIVRDAKLVNIKAEEVRRTSIR